MPLRHLVAALAGLPLFAATLAAAEPAPRPAPAPTVAAEEEDEADPMLAVQQPVFPWTENQRRTIYNSLLPGAATLPSGDWYYRISHVAREVYDEDMRTNLLGLDDNVKIGLMVGYGICTDVDVTLQRVNGYDLQIEPVQPGLPTRFDYYEGLLTWRCLEQYDGGAAFGGLADVAVIAGATVMARNGGQGDTSIDLGLIAERNFLDDRLRLGLGVVHAGLSMYEATMGKGPPTKLTPPEYDYLVETGAPPAVEPRMSTTAIPFTAKYAITPRWALFAEAIFPVTGYKTGCGPTLATGIRLNTNTHEFSVLFTNSANETFNSVIAGGNQDWNVNLFAFTISAYL
jgi:hypothetical protein